MKQKLCVFTGTRAEYGILKPLLKLLKKSNVFSLHLIVSGMHLSPEFGLTYNEIKADGYSIDKHVEILLSSDTSIGVSKSIGLGLISFSEALDSLKPDMTIVLGDRFETYAFTSASYILNIPITHLYGGEATFGLFDEGIRHSITKMSLLHFTSTENYRKRVIQLGEDPERVFCVGAMGLDTISETNLLSKDELEKSINFRFKQRNLLITYHPVTLEKSSPEIPFQILLSILKGMKNTGVIFTKSNADTHGRLINTMIDNYVTENPDNSISFVSMGQTNYLSTMQFVDAVVGNSSSGIIEAPSFRIGTINIGDRQSGRIKADSVIECLPTRKGIEQAFETLFSKNFSKKLSTVKNPYWKGNSASRIIEILQQKIPYISNTKKVFYDIAF